MIFPQPTVLLNVLYLTSGRLSTANHHWGRWLTDYCHNSYRYDMGWDLKLVLTMSYNIIHYSNCRQCHQPQMSHRYRRSIPPADVHQHTGSTQEMFIIKFSVFFFTYFLTICFLFSRRFHGFIFLCLIYSFLCTGTIMCLFQFLN